MSDQDNTDAEEEYRKRIEEDIAIEKALNARAEEMGQDPFERLRRRRVQLKEEMRQLDIELGEGRFERVWLRKLPEWFWFPISLTHTVIRNQVACERTGDNPTIYHWQRHADLSSFVTNLVLGVLYLALLGALFRLLV